MFNSMFDELKEVKYFKLKIHYPFKWIQLNEK